MRDLLRFIAAMILFARVTRWAPAPRWTLEDAAALSKFLQSPCGYRLRAHLQAQIAVQNEGAARAGTPAACGVACGYKAIWAMFQTLSHVRELPDESSEDAAAGAAAGFEHLSP